MKYLVAGVITLSLILTFTSPRGNAAIPDTEAQKADAMFNNIVNSFSNGSFTPTIPANTNWYDHVSNIAAPAAPSHNHGNIHDNTHSNVHTDTHNHSTETPEQHAAHADHSDHEAANTDIHDSHDDHEEHDHDEEEAHDHVAATTATKTVAHTAHDTHTDTHAGHNHAAETTTKTSAKTSNEKEDSHNHDHGAEPENSMQSAISSINLASGVATLEHDRMKKDIKELTEKVSTTQYLIIAVAIFQALALLVTILFIKNRP